MTLKTTVIGLLMSFAICLPIYGLAADTASPDELLFWESIKDSSNSADFEAYLTQYPNGRFVSLAKNRLPPSSAKSESTNESPQPCTNNCEQTPSRPVLKNYTFKLNDNSEEIELTAIPKKVAERTINLVKDNFHTAIDEGNIPHQLISYLLNSNKVLSGKVFEIGKFTHLSQDEENERFTRYSAVIVAIEENGSIKPYVIDLFTPKKLYPLDEWRNGVIVKDSSASNEEYFTNQFHYTHRTLGQKLTQLTDEARADFVRKASLRNIEIKDY